MNTKYHIAGEEVTVHQKTEHKLKQLSEALSLLDEVSGRLMWAADFAQYLSITDAMYSIIEPLEEAVDQLTEEKENLENCLEVYNEKKEEVLSEAEKEFQECVSDILK